jgi:hypothetical protein
VFSIQVEKEGANNNHEKNSKTASTEHRLFHNSHTIISGA